MDCETLHLCLLTYAIYPLPFYDFPRLLSKVLSSQSSCLSLSENASDLKSLRLNIPAQTQLDCPLLREWPGHPNPFYHIIVNNMRLRVTETFPVFRFLVPYKSHTSRNLSREFQVTALLFSPLSDGNAHFNWRTNVNLSFQKHRCVFANLCAVPSIPVQVFGRFF